MEKHRVKGVFLRYVCVLIRMIRQEGKIDNAGKWTIAG